MFYKVHKFKEGGTLIHYYDPTVDSVEVSINITTGSQADTIPGLTHFLEHMLFTGTSTRNEETIEKKSGDLHNHQNGATSYNGVNLNFLVPTRELEASMAHNGDMLVNSNFPEDKIEREKGPVIAEMRYYEDQDISFRNILNNNLMSYCFDYNVDCGNMLGTEESVRSITRQDLIDYRNKYFNRSNLVVCMYGNVTYEDAKRLCKQYIVSKLPEKGEMFLPKMMEAKLKTTSDLILQTVNSNSSYVQICFPIIGKQNYKSALCSNYINSILTSELTRVLRRQYGLIYTPYVYDFQSLNEGVKVIDLQVENDKVNETLRLVAKIVGDLLKRNGITQEEFSSIKQQYLDAGKFGSSNYIYGKTSKMYQSYLNNDKIYSDREKRNIADFITKNDVNSYMEKVLGTNQVIVNVVGNKTRDEMYNIDQIQALFALNRYSREELKKYFNYDVPDMGCPGEFIVLDKKQNKFVNTQLMLEHFDDDKVKKIIKEVKKYNEEHFPKTVKKFWSDMTDKEKQYVIDDLKKKNLLDSTNFDEQVFEVPNSEKPNNFKLPRPKASYYKKENIDISLKDLTEDEIAMLEELLLSIGVDLKSTVNNVHSYYTQTAGNQNSTTEETKKPNTKKKKTKETKQTEQVEETLEKAL